MITTEVGNMIRTSISDKMKEREQSGIIKHDLIDTLITLKNEDKDKMASKYNAGNSFAYIDLFFRKN